MFFESLRAVSRKYINVCNFYMFSVVNVYLDHLKLWGVCIYGQKYVCCSECNVVSNECNEPNSCLVLPIVFDSVYVDLQYDEIYLTVTAGSVIMWSSLEFL